MLRTTIIALVASVTLMFMVSRSMGELIINPLQDDSVASEVVLPGVPEGMPAEAWSKLDKDQIFSLMQQPIRNLKRDFGSLPLSWSSLTELLVALVRPIVAIVGVFGGGVMVVFFVVRGVMANRRLLHEQRMALIEKGEFDPSLLTTPAESKSQKHYTWGLVVLFAGSAFTLFRLITWDIHNMGIGFVSIAVGVAFLIASGRMKKLGRGGSDKS